MCLAFCPEYNAYFCNGKGSVTQSHIIHFLKKVNSTSISLLDDNPFSKIDLRCYICQSNNVFNLGFVTNDDNDSIFIACRSPCQFDKQLSISGKPKFIPFVSNGQINEQLVKIPLPSDYKKISVAETIQIIARYTQKDDSITSNGTSSLPYLQTSFSSVEEYSSVMSSFVEAEQESHLEFENMKRFGDISFIWRSSQQCVFFARPSILKYISNGSHIKFSNDDCSEKGFVHNVSRDHYVTVVFPRPSSFFNVSRGIYLSLIGSNVTFQRQLKALSIFTQNPKCMHYLIRDAFLGNTIHFSRHNRVKGQKIGPISLPSSFPIMNESQLRAITIALNNRFTLIQGPPGTGKTTVIAALVASFVAAGITPILVLTQTNIAADFATKRISETGTSVVRILSSTLENAAFFDVPSDQMNFASRVDIHQFSSFQLAHQQYGDHFLQLYNSSNPSDKYSAKRMEFDVISSYKVICTTCGTAGSSRLSSIRFPVMIVDESGQCLDPDLLIGAIHGVQQLVLVGDHRQLGPVVLSNAARKSRYDLSLMKRLSILNVKPCILTTQYRMHPSISLFPSQTFYMSLLKNGVDELFRQWTRPILPWPKADIPIMFWNIDSKEEHYDSAISFVNPCEADCIAQIVDTMARNGIVSGRDIGIITPYTGQQVYLMDNLDRMCSFADTEIIQDIEIASVDAFQGREKNFIILSCVRANDNHEIGFLRDLRRLCVSLTRAKYGLIIIGNANTFAKNTCWCQLVCSFQSRGCFVEGELQSLMPSSFTALSDSGIDDVESELFEDDLSVV